MTKREFYAIVRSIIENTNDIYQCDENAYSSEDMLTFIDKAVASLDARLTKDRERSAQKRAEDTLLDEVYSVITDEFETVADIASRVSSADATVGKVIYRLNRLASEGKVVKTEGKIPATETSKARSVKMFKRATNETV